MKKNPERLAWTVLLGAFGVFCVLAISIPLGVRWYITTATRPQATQLEVIGGTVLVDAPGQSSPSGITNAGQIVETGRAKTDDTSWASLTFFDESNAVIYSKTEMEVLKARTRQFQFGTQPDIIDLVLKDGRVRLDVAPAASGRSRQFAVETPHSTVQLQEGSYSVEVTGDTTDIAVRDGRAVVSGAGGEREISRGERTSVAMGQPPSKPMPASRDLVVNGTFKSGLGEWSVYNEQGVDAGVVNGQADVVLSNDRSAVRISRMGEDGNHCETGVVQEINRDVRDFTSLRFHADVQVLYQSLSGGGYLSSEFPVIVRIDYKDTYGIERFWTRGFYYQNDSGFSVQNGEQIPRYRWYPYESGNLMKDLGDIRPSWITSIRIYASGWNYQSLVSEVGLIVE
jgi:hypothetical protein